MASSWGVSRSSRFYAAHSPHCSLPAYCYHNQNHGRMLPDGFFFLCIHQSSVTENRNHSSYFKHEGQRASNRELGAYNVLRLGLQDWVPEEQWRICPQGGCQLCLSQEDAADLTCWSPQRCWQGCCCRKNAKSPWSGLPWGAAGTSAFDISPECI